MHARCSTRYGRRTCPSTWTSSHRAQARRRGRGRPACLRSRQQGQEGLRYLESWSARRPGIEFHAPGEAPGRAQGHLRRLAGKQAGAREGLFPGRFDPTYLKALRIAVVRFQGKAVAFANLLETERPDLASIDLMRVTADAAQADHGIPHARADPALQGRRLRALLPGHGPAGGLHPRRGAPSPSAWAPWCSDVANSSITSRAAPLQGQVRSGMGTALHGGPRRPGSPGRLRRYRRPNRRGLYRPGQTLDAPMLKRALAVLLVILLIAGGLGWWWLHRWPRRPRSRSWRAGRSPADHGRAQGRATRSRGPGHTCDLQLADADLLGLATNTGAEIVQYEVQVSNTASAQNETSHAAAKQLSGATTLSAASARALPAPGAGWPPRTTRRRRPERRFQPGNPGLPDALPAKAAAASGTSPGTIIRPMIRRSSCVSRAMPT